MKSTGFLFFCSFVSSIVNFFVNQVKPEEIFDQSMYMCDIHRIIRNYPTDQPFSWYQPIFETCPPKWAFSVINLFLYSGLWQTHFSTFEKRNRPHSRPFGPELLSSILVLHSISWSVRLPAPWYIYEARLYNVVRL